MPVNGFLVNNTVQKYNYESLENYNTPDFSTSSTYQVGDYVMYQGKLYKCITAITTSGAWDSTKWSLAILSDDVADLKSAIGETFLSSYLSNGLPVLYLEHPDLFNLKTKEDGKLSNVSISFPSRRINEKLKTIAIQGASSQAYPKKNYTITFKNPVVINPNWGSHKKYVIKADWVDFSHMRNVFAAKTWGAIRKTRINENRSILFDGSNYFVDGTGNTLSGETDPSLSMGMNFGAIDGYPICVVINGKYWGIYSVNIPKDDWMAGMLGESDTQCIVSAEHHSTATSFQGLVNPIDGEEMTDVDTGVVAFTLEYTPDEDNTSWVSTSINTMITAARGSHSTAVEYRDAISPYVDVDSAIDYYIFSCLINNVDGTDKNYLLDTWDGTKWYFMAYDMDQAFGSQNGGRSYAPIKGGVTFTNYAGSHRLMNIIKTYFTEDLKTRYQELRSSVLSNEKICDEIWNYAANIPKSALDYECILWSSRPGTLTNNYIQIENYYKMRSNYLDEEISAL